MIFHNELSRRTRHLIFILFAGVTLACGPTKDCYADGGGGEIKLRKLSPAQFCDFHCDMMSKFCEEDNPGEEFGICWDLYFDCYEKCIEPPKPWYWPF